MKNTAGIAPAVFEAPIPDAAESLREQESYYSERTY
jgi:hypothetical protein